MSNIFVSEAFNKNTGSTSYVSHNSGTLSLSFNLGKIVCGLDKESFIFDLRLEHIQGHTERESGEYFLGWKFNIPTLKLSGKKRGSFLNNIGGPLETLTDGELTLTTHRIKNVKILQYEDEYRVVHKNGFTEVYSSLKISSDRVTVDYILDPLGRKIVFEYTEDNYISNIHLSMDNNKRIDFDYSGNNILVVREWAGSLRNATTIVLSDDGVVHSISEKNDTDNKTAFGGSYHPLTGFYINTIAKPNGENIFLTYLDINYSDAHKVKAVSSLTISGYEGDETLTYNYTYSENNYTGYRPGVEQEEGVDNCINIEDEYNYFVTETRGASSTVYKFNKLHLMIYSIEEEVKSRTSQLYVFYDYNLVSGNIYDQPLGYSFAIKETLAKQSDITMSGYSHIKNRSYDDYGNLLSSDNDVETTTYEYYPISSPGDFDSHFIKNLKKITSVTKSNNQKTITKEFTYQLVTGFIADDINGVSQRVFRSMPHTYKENGIAIRDTEYFDHIAGIDICGLVKKIINYNNYAAPIDIENLFPALGNISTSYTYIGENADAIKFKILERTESSSVSGFKESYIIVDYSHYLNVVESSDFNGNITYIEYDKLNRKTKIIRRDIKQEKTVETIGYTPNIEGSNLITHTSGTGVISSYYYNAYDNLTSKKVSGILNIVVVYKDSKIFSIQEYPVYGTDGLITYYEHDLFGITKTTYPDGKIENVERSGLNSSLIYNAGMDLLKTIKYDTSGRMVELYVDDTLIEKYEFGDFDDEPTRIDTLLHNGKVENVFDQFGRLSSVVNYRSNIMESIINYGYQSSQVSSPSHVAVTNEYHTVYQEHFREHDAYGRPIREGYIEGGDLITSKRFDYANPYDEIPLRTFDVADNLCRSVVIDRVHNKIQQEFLFTHSYQSFKYIYSYDKFGNLLTSKEYNHDGQGEEPTYTLISSYIHTYDVNHNLSSSTIIIGGTTYLISQTKQASGHISSYNNHLGKSQYYSYDSMGRLKQKRYNGFGGNDLNIAPTYSSVTGELDKLVFSMQLNSKLVEMHVDFEYDKAGSITSIVTEISYNSTVHSSLSVDTKYDKGGSIVNSIIARMGGDSKVENYSYSGSSPSLYSHEKNNVNYSFNYDTPEMISSISNDATSTSIFTATYENDALRYIFKDNTHYNYNISYLGDITSTEFGTYMEYDRNARMLLSSSSSRVISTYNHNPSDRVSSIFPADSDPIHYLYLENHLVGEVSGQSTSVYITFGKFKFGRWVQTDTGGSLELFGIDPHNTVLMQSDCTTSADPTPTSYYQYDTHGMREIWL